MTCLSEYRQYISSKHCRPASSGFEPASLNVNLFDWQRRLVERACQLGRSAIFAECGLGKTLMQLAWASSVVGETGGSVLILTPLSVGPQTVAEAERFGIASVSLAKSQSDCRGGGIYVTNYQKLHHFAPSSFAGVVLDESSILKSFMGKTKRLLLEAFSATPFRLACTATPAPNDHMELGNHAEFLGIMPSNEMLARWFIADQANCGKYRLKGHAADDFWSWVSSWASCVSRPSDAGGDDSSHVLPPLTWHEHVVTAGLTPGVGELFASGDLTATSMHAEMKKTASARAEMVAKIVSEKPGEAWAVWCNTNYEADELMRLLPAGTIEVRGSDSDEAKECKLRSFADGRARILVGKPTICGFGLNWQHCHNVAFVGVSYSFEQLYQAIRRTWRFGQKSPVNAHVVVADGEYGILKSIHDKMKEHENMASRMSAATRTDKGVKVGLASGRDGKLEDRGQSWTMLLGDCVERVAEMDANSIDFTIFSPPFAGLYIYSAAMEDMGNSASDDEFFRHFGFLVPELLRVTVPGRLCAVHCKDLPRYAGRDGTAGLKDFPGEIIRLFSSHGWSYHSRVAIWKCPVVERERTNNNGLLHKTLKRDSSQLRQGMADYLVVFRKPPRQEDGLLSVKPIERPNGLEYYVGDSDPRQSGVHPSPYARRPSDDPALAVWQRYAEPVWWDVNQLDTLNERLGREAADEKHICPLQLGVIRRAIHLWTQPGELVLSPFAGIGSEGYGAIQERRRFVGVELKPSYYSIACRHLREAESLVNQPSLPFEEAA